ncbi:hypothetical protein AB4H70_003911, partial [Escherichia coli]
SSQIKHSPGKPGRFKQLGLLSLERQQDSQPVNQQSEHEPEPASRVKRDLSEVEFESTMKRKRFM